MLCIGGKIEHVRHTNKHIYTCISHFHIPRCVGEEVGSYL